jgi:hypothetical protein|uniref:Uncharacterized protein n=1 Tax=Oryza nivara TaxID=4536 RepID=A0A0E0IWN8_ORYNI
MAEEGLAELERSSQKQSLTSSLRSNSILTSLSSQYLSPPPPHIPAPPPPSPEAAIEGFVLLPLLVGL